MPDTINTFIVYAREDTNIKHRLLAHLNPFVKGYNLVLWHDEYLEAGQEWKPHIESRLEKTDLFLLLISVDFMNSEFINQVEFKFAIDRHKAGKSIVIPIIINYCQWDIDFYFTEYNFNLNELQVLPQAGMPVDDWKTPEQAYNNIASGIRKVLDTIKAKRIADEKIRNELENNKTEIINLNPPDLPGAKNEEEMIVEKTDHIPLQKEVLENESNIEENIIAAQPSGNPVINSAGYEFEEVQRGFWTRKKYIIAALSLVILICILYWFLGADNFTTNKFENDTADTASKVASVPDKSVDTNHKMQDPTADKSFPENPVVKLEDNTLKPSLKNDDKVYSKVEVEAGFAGGEDGWRNFLRNNLNASTPVKFGAAAGKYVVIVKFVVSKDGSLNNIACENDPGFGMGQEAVRVIKASPKWTPAIQNGRNVNAYRRQPITFVVSE